jgi:predicted phosphodiesterase
VNLDFSNQGDELVTAQISSEMLEASPDFVMHLGDVLDYHEFGFNVAPYDPILSRWAYQNYRNAMGNTIGRAAHFSAVGNWDGENGDFTDEQVQRSRSQRMLYLPNPSPETYPQGGSPGQDYYAFTWGDALFIVLNVMTYTKTSHLLTGVDEYPDDWTLGQQQLDWLESTLAGNDTRWKFLFIHHTVAGAGPNLANAAYGRGGGQAAHVGEQAIIHQMMLDHDATVFFHGHDHVFVDMTVDGIHYTDPGAAGAPWKFESDETGYVKYYTDSGWSRVTVSDERVHVEFLAMGGELLDEYYIPPLPDAGVDETTSSSGSASSESGDSSVSNPSSDVESTSSSVGTASDVKDAGADASL